MKLEAPQLIVLAIHMLSLGIDVAKDGQPKTGKHKFTGSIFGSAVAIALLWWGGFFH
jgi:hypothetical protein